MPAYGEVPEMEESTWDNKPVVISDLQRLEKVYPDEAAFFRGVWGDNTTGGTILQADQSGIHCCG